MIYRYALYAVFALAFSVPAFAQASKICEQPKAYIINKEKPSVYIEFEQFGKADDWQNARLGEVSKKLEIKKGNDVWLRLYNNSCWELQIPTFSMYMSMVKDEANPEKKKVIFGRIEDGTAANVFYKVEEDDRKQVVWGGHSYSESFLPPGFSVLFPVHREHLENDRSIYVNFTYEWESKQFSSNLSPLHRSFFWGYRLEEVKKK